MVGELISSLAKWEMSTCHGVVKGVHLDGVALAMRRRLAYICLRAHWPNKSSAVAELGDRLAKIDVGRKWGAALWPFHWRCVCVPLWPFPLGELGLHL